MSDQRFRERERELEKKPDDLDVRVRWMNERLRYDEPCPRCPSPSKDRPVRSCSCLGTGRLWLPRFMLLSYCAYAPAEQVVGNVRKTFEFLKRVESVTKACAGNREPNYDWFRPLRLWGMPIAIRAAVAVGTRAFEEWPGQHPCVDDMTCCADPCDALAIASDWLLLQEPRQQAKCTLALVTYRDSPKWATGPLASIVTMPDATPSWFNGIRTAYPVIGAQKAGDAARSALTNHILSL